MACRTKHGQYFELALSFVVLQPLPAGQNIIRISTQVFHFLPCCLCPMACRTEHGQDFELALSFVVLQPLPHGLQDEKLTGFQLRSLILSPAAPAL